MDSSGQRLRGTPDLVSTSARLPGGFRVRFRLTSARRIGVEWQPSIPRFRNHRFKRRFLEHYWLARREFAEQCATVVGGGVVFVDTDGGSAARCRCRDSDGLGVTRGTGGHAPHAFYRRLGLDRE